MTTLVPLSEAKAHLSELVGRAATYHERVTVTVHGQPSAVLMSAEDLESLEETLTILADRELVRELAEAKRDRERGEYVTADELAATVAERLGRSV
jgi:prevent-host-death family protein